MTAAVRPTRQLSPIVKPAKTTTATTDLVSQPLKRGSLRRCGLTIGRLVSGLAFSELARARLLLVCARCGRLGTSAPWPESRPGPFRNALVAVLAMLTLVAVLTD